jgi:hypothetical protein
MKILVIGIGQANFLSSLYGGVKKIKTTWQVDLIGLKKLSSKKLYSEDSIFSSVLHTPIFSLKALPQIFAFKIVRRILLNHISNSGFSQIKSVLRKLTTSCQLSKKFDKLYDAFHFHFITAANVFPVFFLNNKVKIICSFWGSDLMRISGNFDHYVVTAALKRANIITVQSIELKEILLSKYGRELSEKVVIAQFVLEEKIYDALDQYASYHATNDSTNAVTGIASDLINVIIGHNSYPQNNHVAVIEALAALPPESKSKIRIIVPFTYGLRKEKRLLYQQTLEQLLLTNSFSYKIIDTFLDWDQLVFLRANTDIFIHVPVSDALSGAATEAMYAGSLLVTGAWLPYGPFRRAGLKYIELDSPNSISKAIQPLIEQGKKKGETNNRQLIKKHFLGTEIITNWISLYENRE